MKKYLGVKIVEAEPMTNLDFQEKIKNSKLLPGVPFLNGYKVVYEDGYVSWSPKEVFEKAYRTIDGLTFGLAIEALKQSKKVARAGWNGIKMSLETNGVFQNNTIALFIYHSNDGSKSYLMPSPSDMLAEDWQIVE